MPYPGLNVAAAILGPSKKEEHAGDKSPIVKGKHAAMEAFIGAVQDGKAVEANRHMETWHMHHREEEAHDSKNPETE